MRQSLSTFSSENPSDGEEGTASEPSPSGTPEVGSTNTDERPDERSDDMCSQGSELPSDPPASEVVTDPEPSSLPIPQQDLLRGEQVSHLTEPGAAAQAREVPEFRSQFPPTKTAKSHVAE